MRFVDALQGEELARYGFRLFGFRYGARGLDGVFQFTGGPFTREGLVDGAGQHFGEEARDGVADLTLYLDAGRLDAKIGGESLEGGHFAP